jgi:hypothetical protein
MEEPKINNLQDFIDQLYIDPLNTWKYIFRGQNIDKPLLPKIARNTRLKINEIRQIEKKVLNEFKLKSRPFIEYKPETDWEWLAIAQHNGLKTRLLDWTENALAALWFCVEKVPSNNEGNGVVWVFSTFSEFQYVDIAKVEDPFSIEETKILQPPYVSKRIIAQTGLFTIHKLQDKDQICIPLENHDRYKGLLKKLIIPYNSFDKIKNQLNKCGINNSTLFPGLDSLCDSINDILKSSERIQRIMNMIGSLKKT